MILIKQLREVGAILGLNCGDNGCVFGERTGAGTNGGCQCDLVEAVLRMRDERGATEERMCLALGRFEEREALVIDLALDAHAFARTFADQVPDSALALQRRALAVRDFRVTS